MGILKQLCAQPESIIKGGFVSIVSTVNTMKGKQKTTTPIYVLSI